MAKLSPEDALVRKIYRGWRAAEGLGIRLGAGDDAALWQPGKGHEAILTSDWFLEGTHFLREKHPPDAVGWKCLARAASDIAAMGGTPRCFLLNLALPAECTGKWLSGFLGGLHRAGRFLRCTLAGGDTTRQERILINVTVIGEVAAGRAVLRSGARDGDLLFVSGRLGEAELGLRLLRKNRGKMRATNAAVRKHLYPEPRIGLGSWLAQGRLVSAMMDISDGLSTDLARLCAASGVGATIVEKALPIAHGIAHAEAVRLALHGGDDYELLFTAGPRQAKTLREDFRALPVSCIGQIVRREEVLVLKEDGKRKRLLAGGWDPFRE
jgi:thiamine-monophosphate kinase